MSRLLRQVGLVTVALVTLLAALAPVVAPHAYDEQFREAGERGPSRQFPMGTDNLGRDRFSRLLYATRVSIVLAPAAAAVSIVIALAVSSLSGLRVRLMKRAVSGLTTLSLALPWIFLFITLRALLPLNTRPLASMVLTFGLMGVAGWAWPARVFTASVSEVESSGWLLQARAAGVAPLRVAVVYAWPHLRAIAAAQFRVLLPAYILSEASLGLLGLGVAEPLPSWGNMLAELQHPDRVRENPWVLAPLVLLMIVMVALEALQPARAKDPA